MGAKKTIRQNVEGVFKATAVYKGYKLAKRYRNDRKYPGLKQARAARKGMMTSDQAAGRAASQLARKSATQAVYQVNQAVPFKMKSKQISTAIKNVGGEVAGRNLQRAVTSGQFEQTTEKILDKAAKRYGARFGTKAVAKRVATRAIPVVGTALIAKDVYDVTNWVAKKASNYSKKKVVKKGPSARGRKTGGRR